MYNQFKQKLSSYIITYVNLLSFVLFFMIINNNILLVCYCSSAPPNFVQVLLNDNNNWTAPFTPETPSSNYLSSFSVIDEKQQGKDNQHNKSNTAEEKYNFKSYSSNNGNSSTNVPQNMQWKRFMWKEVDQTMENIAQGVANGARAMTKMFENYIPMGPALTRHKKAATSFMPIPAPSTNLKYVIKTPMKRSRIVKLAANPRKIVKIISPSSSSSSPHFEAITKSASQPQIPVIKIGPKKLGSSGAKDYRYLDEEILRDIEKKEEEKVEATISAILPNYDGSEEIIIGKHKYFEDDWKPVTLSSPIDSESYYSSPVSLPSSLDAVSSIKSKPMSQLHTKITDLPLERPVTHSYEVTENSAEETIEQPNAFTSQKYATYKIGDTFRAVTSTENFVIHKTKTNSSNDETENNISNLKKRQQHGNNISSSSSSYSIIYNAPKIENRTTKTITSTAKPSFSSSSSSAIVAQNSYLHTSKLPITLKKKSRELETTGGYRKLKNVQGDNETNHSSVQDKKETNIRSRGSKKFGDKLQ